MILDRVGPSFSWAAVFPRTRMEDTWYSTRPPLTTRVAGAGGAYWLRRDNAAPIAPLTVRKRFAIVEPTSQAVEDRLNEWRQRTIATTDPVTLWWLDRDGSTYYYNKAYCTRFESSETYRESSMLVRPVQIEFIVPSGLWYGALLDLTVTTNTVPVHSTGNLPRTAHIILTFTASGGDITFAAGSTFDVSHTLGGALCSLDVGGQTLADGQAIVIDAYNYQVTFAGTDYYDKLTPQSLAWMWVYQRFPDISGEEIRVSYSATVYTGHTLRVQIWEEFLF